MENENKFIKGQPGLVLLPARSYSLKQVVKPYIISIPISGKFSELYPDFVELIEKHAHSDDFVVALQKESEARKEVILSSIAIIEILFAAKKYPALNDNQIFSIVSITFDSKDNILHIVGGILEFVE